MQGSQPRVGCAAGPSSSASVGSGAFELLTPEQIEMSPSRQFLLTKCDGDLEKAKAREEDYRISACGFISESGQALRVPQLTIATAVVFYHRFFARKSYELFDRHIVATTCLFLASKVEETPKKLKDVVIECRKVQLKTETGLDPESREFWECKEKVLISERILLQTLGFDLTVEHAYRPLLAYVKAIKGTRDLAQVAWNFINDSLRTTICLQYPARCVSAASAFLAAGYLAQKHHKKGFELPLHQGSRPWHAAFQVKEGDYQEVALRISTLYDGKSGMHHQLANKAFATAMKAIDTSRNANAASAASAASVVRALGSASALFDSDDEDTVLGSLALGTRCLFLLTCCTC